MLEVIALAAGLAAGGGFFDGREVDFWESRRRAPAATPELWADSTAPPPVRRLLESPTPDHARAYLAWQDERLRRLRAAMAAVEAARVPSAPVLYFARDGCRWCALQDRELEGLPVRRVPPGSPLWAEYRVESTPTLVVGGAVLRGFTPRDALLKELSHD